MPRIHKYLDWKSYFVGLYLSWIKSLTTTLIALGGTNAAESMGVKGVGISWQQACGVFFGITFWEIVKYVNAKPLPDTREEQVETTITPKPPTSA